MAAEPQQPNPQQPLQQPSDDPNIAALREAEQLDEGIRRLGRMAATRSISRNLATEDAEYQREFQRMATDLWGKNGNPDVTASSDPMDIMAARDVIVYPPGTTPAIQPATTDAAAQPATIVPAASPAAPPSAAGSTSVPAAVAGGLSTAAKVGLAAAALGLPALGAGGMALYNVIRAAPAVVPALGPLDPGSVQGSEIHIVPNQ